MRYQIPLMAFATCFAGTAWAADLPYEPAPIVAPPAPLITNWSGVYFGLQGGYATDLGSSVRDTEVDGFVGGAHAGYLHQFGRFVVGLEGDAEFANVDADDDGWLDDNDTARFAHTAARQYNFLASARLRAGVAFGNFLVYGTGGYAFANADVETRNERRFGNENDFRAFGSESENLHGYTIGAGAEALVTKRLSVGLEYRYTDFENTDIVGRRLVDGPSFDAGELENNFHAIRARVSFHF